MVDCSSAQIKATVFNIYTATALRFTVLNKTACHSHGPAAVYSTAKTDITVFQKAPDDVFGLLVVFKDGTVRNGQISAGIYNNKRSFGEICSVGG